MQVTKNLILMILLWAWILPGPFFIEVAQAKPKIKIGVFDAPSNHEHSKKVVKIIKDELKSAGGSVKIIEYPIYDSSGSLVEAMFKSQLEKALKDGVRIFHFSWNLKHDEKFSSVLKVLEKISGDSKNVIVAAAGVSEPPMRLSETVMGKVSHVIIVGELVETGHLHARSNYGRELFTALKSTPDLLGSSGTAALFSARLAANMSSKSTLAKNPSEFLVKAKEKSATRFPTLDMIFKL